MEEKRRDGERRPHHRGRDKEHRDRDERRRDRKDDKPLKEERYNRYAWEDKDKSLDEKSRNSREREQEYDKEREKDKDKHRDKDAKRKRDSQAKESQHASSKSSKRNRTDSEDQKVDNSNADEQVNGHVPPPPPDQSEAAGEDAKQSEKDKKLLQAKKLIQLRKELAEKLKNLPQVNKVAPATSESATTAANIASHEGYKRVQECVARLGFQQPPGSFQVPGAAPAGPKSVKAPVLRLDAQGREIDENGVVVDRRKSNISTLKVNINKQKKDAFQILHPELEEDPVNNPHFDTELGVDKTKLVRPKRSTFQFVEEGRWTKKAEIIRLNSRFGAAKAREIRSKQAALAKAKAEGDINPNLIEVTERIFKDDKQKDPIPNIEWWDLTVLPPQTQSYEDAVERTEVKFKKDKINIYVEHPVPIEPPAEPAPPPPQPLKLTKKEQKKMRTQRRLAREKERQELIRQGKIEAPKAKVKMSNLMNVLAAEATQDPTRMEQEIRSAAAERERAHIDRNLARKLTPSERREKKEKRLFDDPSTLETIVSVFRVNDISHPQTRFKVDINAQENRLTGCAIITDDMTVVIVEGGAKSIKRYTKLMLRRINWAAKEDGAEEDDDAGQQENKCVQVWQGSVARPAFDRFFFQKFHTPGAARKYLADAGVGHYWDSALHYKEES